MIGPLAALLEAAILLVDLNLLLAAVLPKTKVVGRLSQVIGSAHPPMDQARLLSFLSSTEGDLRQPEQEQVLHLAGLELPLQQAEQDYCCQPLPLHHHRHLLSLLSQ